LILGLLFLSVALGLSLYHRLATVQSLEDAPPIASDIAPKGI
jgi:hypothetical protein